MKNSTRMKTTLLVFSLIIMLTSAAHIALSVTETFRPVIISVSPTNELRDLPINTSITATFSKDMDQSTITSDTFYLEQTTTMLEDGERSMRLAANVSYDESTRTATLHPIDPIWPNQHFGNVYTATITTDVKDKDANAMEHTYVWSFTTGIGRYNTGMDTSAQNDTASLLTPPQIPPQVLVPISPVPITPTVPSPSYWLSPTAIALYILILVLAVTLIFILFGTRKSNTTRTAFDNDAADPVDPINEIQGIGAEYSSRLQLLGIRSRDALIKSNTRTLANKLGISTKLVQHWQQMAQLMSVRGIGPQYAELLERSGVTSIEKLASSTPDVLLKQVQTKQQSLDVNIQGNTLGKATVEGWIAAANDYQHTVQQPAKI